MELGRREKAEEPKDERREWSEKNGPREEGAGRWNFVGWQRDDRK